MNEFEEETVFDLAVRLNQLIIEGDKLEMQMIQINKEYNEVVHKLWDRIPSLKDDTDIRPKTKILRPKWRDDDV